MRHFIGPHDATAHCYQCNKDWSGKNAQAVAAIHARKWKHRVSVDVTQVIIYDFTEGG